jgi:hypothetical protein
VTTIEPIPPIAAGRRAAPFRVEVSGTLEDPRLRTQVPLTHVFLVAASGPGAAQVAAAQLFGREAGRRRCVALPGHTVRVLLDDE